MSPSWQRIVWLVLGAVLAILQSPVNGFAHAVPDRALPPIEGVVSEAPAILRLWFTEELVTDQLTIAVLGPNGERVDGGDAAVDLYDPERRTAQVSLRPNLGSGIYTVQWHSASALDEDAVDGSFRFTVDPRATPPTIPAITVVTPVETIPPAPAEAQDGGGLPGTLLGPIIIGGVLLATLVWTTIRRRDQDRRRGP